MTTTRFAILGVVFVIGCERADSLSVESESIAPPALETDRVQFTEQLTAREPAPPAVAPPVNLQPQRRVTTAMRWFLGLSTEQRQGVSELCRQRSINPCFGLLPMRDGADPQADLLAALDPEERDGADTYCRERNPRAICDTPLVVAFAAQPIEFTPASDARFAFAPGTPAATDWPTAATPWIALDRDGDGAITSGAELFGDSTVLPGGATARNGFAALAALDANHDGTIDRADPAFASLLLWADLDGDRASSPAELRPLASVVTAIPLANRLDARCTDRGACEGERGTMIWQDAHGARRTGAVVDVYLPRR